MENLFGGAYKNKTVLLTGDTGFKGSWLGLWLKKMGAKVVGYALPPHTHPSHFEILKTDYESISGNILDKSFLNLSVNRVKPDIIFHLAAQALVRESYRDPIKTYETNVMGTLNVLEAARSCTHVKAFVNVTTDKVYNTSENIKPFRESDAFGGHDMYSSSKACSEILTESYRKSFLENTSLLVASARAGNVIGGGDWSDDRLLPDAMKAASAKRKVVIRYPRAVRPWQHVLEPLTGYLLLGKKLLEGKSEFATGWNFGPRLSDCIPVEEVLLKITNRWDEVIWENDKGENPPEAPLLMLDSSKANKELSWKPVWDLDAAVNKTVDWYKAYFREHIAITESQIGEYSRLLQT